MRVCGNGVGVGARVLEREKEEEKISWWGRWGVFIGAGCVFMEGVEC